MQNKLDKQYTDFLQDILDNGHAKGDRTGTGTTSVFGRQFRHNMKDGFPMLTTKKLHFQSIVTELLWFLKGDTNIKYLLEHNCNIWNGDAYKNYEKGFRFARKMQSSVSDVSDWVMLTKDEFIEKIKTDTEFAAEWGRLGPVYGRQWRRWTTSGKPIDQIEKLIIDLKENPDSRRLIVNAWNVGEIDEMVLPPCHYGFQMYTRLLTTAERAELAGHESKFISPMTVESWDRNGVPTRAISLMWNQRSVDTFLGLPFNIASYALLLCIIAKDVNMVPEDLIGNLGDTHLYNNHIEQAKEQISRVDAVYDLPQIKIHDTWKFSSASPIFADVLKHDMFELVDYKAHPTIKAPLSN